MYKGLQMSSAALANKLVTMHIYNITDWNNIWYGSNGTEVLKLHFRFVNQKTKAFHFYSSSSSPSSSSSSSSPSGVSGAPSFLPGRTPNHFGSFAFGLFCHSLNFSFHANSRASDRRTSAPPSYNFFLSP